MPQRSSEVLARPRRRVTGPAVRRRRADGIVLAIYLAAFTIPGLGSTLVWIVAVTTWGGRGLVRHLVRALRIQAACLAAMLLVQASVVALLWAGFPWMGPPGLRLSLELAGLQLTVGLFLAMGLLGPILVLAEGPRSGGPRAPSPGGRRAPTPSSPSAATRPPAAIRRMAAAG